MELMRILGTVLGGSSRYVRLLAAKADECLQVRIRGSLSESENSNEMAVVEEINDDDDENYEKEGNVYYGPSTADDAPKLLERGKFHVKRSVDNPQASYDLNALSPSILANEMHMPFLVSTPDWNRILERIRLLIALLLMVDEILCMLFFLYPI